MTEDEAKTKWCPLTRLAYGAGVNGSVTLNRDRYGQPFDEARCLGSRCMMWVADYVKSSTGKEGYCGIARSPERIR